MSKSTTLYFDGDNSDAQEVCVLFFNTAVHLYTTNDQLLQRFPLKRTFLKQTGSHQFLYLNEKQTQYLQFSNDHPLTATLSQEVSESNMTFPKRLLRSRALLILSFLLAFIAGIYFLIICLVPYLGNKIISRNREIEMGNKLHASMLAEARLLGEEMDVEGTHHLQAFANELQLSSNYPIRVTLLKSTAVNAYALPGGNVVVYTELLQKIKSPEALAALLAHESTHVNERHSLRSLLRNAASSIALSVVFGDASGIASILVSNAETLNGLRYSRSLEEEADRKGMELLLQNDVAVNGMQQLMQTLQQEAGANQETLSFLSSHPLTEERLKNAKQFIKEHPQKIEQKKDLQTIFKSLKKDKLLLVSTGTW
jgi:beta-barrel assembly-enhancing protease